MDLFNTEIENKGKLPFDLPNKEGYSSEWNENLNGFVITIPNGELFYSEHFF